MKTIGIDLRCLPQDGSPGAGVAHAARAIVGAMCEYRGDAEVILYVPAGARRADAAEGARTDVDAGEGARHRRARTTGVVALPDARRLSLVRALKDHPCDILFVPSGAVPIGLPVPAIPWVHDVDIFSHPEWFPQSRIKRMLTTRMFLRGVKKAPVIFAVSEYTKRELLKLVLRPQDEIVVTGEGGDPALASWDREKAGARLASFGIQRPFVFMLGTVEPRKNIPFIVNLWPSIVRAAGRGQRAEGYDLVIAGKDGWRHGSINEAIRRARAMRLSDVDETLKRDLLVWAALVLTPSLSEGFGLVPLEAIQAGTPVLVSDRGALPEVAGRGDWVIPLEDPDRWLASITRILNDEGYRGEIIKRQSSAAIGRTREFAGKTICDTIGKRIH
jgi:glycosyltransferase involved in cell wall biosynthesis